MNRAAHTDGRNDPLELFVNGRQDHPLASNKPATISIDLHVGNATVRMREYLLQSDDGDTLAAIADSATSEIFESLGQLQDAIRKNSPLRRYLHEVSRMCARAAQSSDPRELSAALALIGKCLSY